MAFLEFDTMKEAERATYSFITALEEGKAIDVKKAIQDNRGGGAVHTEADLADRANRLNAQQQKAKDAADAIQAEADRLAAITLEKTARREAKLAAQKLDWVAGDECWAPIGGKFVQVKVVRNVPAMGVTVELPGGKTAMVDAKKLKTELPDGADAPSAPAAPKAANPNAGASRGGRGGSAGASRGAAGAGRGRGRGK